MTIRVRFYVVDVFASQPLTGNPLPLVPDADALDEARICASSRASASGTSGSGFPVSGWLAKTSTT